MLALAHTRTQPELSTEKKAQKEDGMGEAGAGEIQVQRVQREKKVAQVPVTNPQRENQGNKKGEQEAECSKQDNPGSTSCYEHLQDPAERTLRTLSTIELEIQKARHWIACGQDR